jgi:TnpA family transposase
MPLQIFTAAERARLNSFPEPIPPEDLSRYYHLSERDKQEVLRQRDEHGRLGFALQLCSLRHLGFIPKNLLQPPLEVLHFVADQLEVSPASLNKYQRPATQSQHLQHILGYTGFRRASPLDDLALADWLVERALEHDKPLLLFEVACDYLRQRNVIRNGTARRSDHEP